MTAVEELDKDDDDDDSPSSDKESIASTFTGVGKSVTTGAELSRMSIAVSVGSDITGVNNATGTSIAGGESIGGDDDESAWSAITGIDLTGASDDGFSASELTGIKGAGSVAGNNLNTSTITGVGVHTTMMGEEKLVALAATVESCRTSKPANLVNNNATHHTNQPPNNKTMRSSPGETGPGPPGATGPGPPGPTGPGPPSNSGNFLPKDSSPPIPPLSKGKWTSGKWGEAYAQRKAALRYFKISTSATWKVDETFGDELQPLGANEESILLGYNNVQSLLEKRTGKKNFELTDFITTYCFSHVGLAETGRQ
eukprot:3991280-Ditylum_brightwellii.AAC.2